MPAEKTDQDIIASLNALDKIELEENFTPILNSLDNISEVYYKIDFFSKLLSKGSKLKEVDLLKSKFKEIVNEFDKMDDYDQEKILYISDLISLELQLLDGNFPTILKMFDNIDFSSEIRDVFSNMISVIKSSHLLEKYFTAILDALDYDNISSLKQLVYLISTIKGTEVLSANYSLIKLKLDVILERINPTIIGGELEYIIPGIKGTKLLEDNITAFLIAIDIYEESNGPTKVDIFCTLILTLKEENLIDAVSSHIKEILLNILKSDPRDNDFSDLIFSLAETELLEENLIVVLNTIDKITREIRQIFLFYELISILKDNGLLENHFVDVLRTIAKNSSNLIRIKIFSKLILEIKYSNLMNKHYRLLNTIFMQILNSYEDISSKNGKFNRSYSQEEKFDLISGLISAIAGTKLLTRNFNDVLNTINKIDDEGIRRDAHKKILNNGSGKVRDA